MTQALLVAGMAVVVLGFLALAFTDSAGVRAERPGMRRAAVGFWWAILIGGWGILAWIALAPPGGLDAASAWLAEQTLVMRIAAWVFLLPWAAAVALWATSLPEPLRVAGVLGIAALTFGLAMRLSRPKPR